MTETKPYDVAAQLKTEEERVLYINAMDEESEGDPETMLRAAEDVARSRILNP